MLLPTSLFIPDKPTPPGVSFRLTAAADCQALYRACYAPQPWNQFERDFRHLLQWQTNGRCYWLIAESPETILGTGQLIRYPHAAELANLMVGAAHRRQGIGTALITILTTIARHIGLSSLQLTVAAQNQPALALYQQLHFKEKRRLRLPAGEWSIVLGKML